MRTPDPVDVLHLFPQERAALLELLSSLAPEEWDLPTVCEGWSVKDVALHILGGDLGNVSRRRDRVRGTEVAPGEDLVTLLNRINQQWVEAARRLSPRVIIDLLEFAGPQLFDYFATLDLSSPGGSVSWAGLSRAPVWLDVAREYTERWLHQQHIRDASGRPGLTGRRFMGSVLATFMYALPHALRDANAPVGAALQVHIGGEAGGDWCVLREPEGWRLYTGTVDHPEAWVAMDQSAAWRLLTRGLTREQAEQAISFAGDEELGRRVLDAVAIIA